MMPQTIRPSAIAARIQAVVPTSSFEPWVESATRTAGAACGADWATAALLAVIMERAATAASFFDNIFNPLDSGFSRDVSPGQSPHSPRNVTIARPAADSCEDFSSVSTLTPVRDD